MTLTDWRVEFLIGASVYDVTPKCEWGVTIEETLGAAAVATFRLQDRATPEWGPFPDIFPSTPAGVGGVDLERLDTRIRLEGVTDPLFRGMVLTPEADLPVATPWPTYTIRCADYQAEVFDRRYVGVPNGSIWLGPDADGNYTPDDPNAVGAATDAATVAALLGAYNAWPPIDTATHVHEYIPDLTGGGYLVPHFDRAPLRGPLDQIAGLAAGNLQYWLDPSLRMHWVVLPRWWEQQSIGASLARGLPETMVPLEAAPAGIDNDAPNGVTTIGCRDLRWGFDYNADTWDYWVNGAVGFAYNGGLVDLGGSGWWPASVPSGTLPQALLDAPDAIDAASKAAAAGRARAMVRQGILRMSFTVGNERHHPDGWHVGQLLPVKDARLPGFLNDRAYVIQRVVHNLIPGQNWRVYRIEVGDAPMGRLSSRKQTAAVASKPDLPGRLWEPAYSEFSPLPSSTVTVVGQLVADDGTPRRAAGITVNLAIETWDDADNPVIPPLGSLSDYAPVTDIMGRWQTDLTVGSEAGYSYKVSPVAAP